MVITVKTAAEQVYEELRGRIVRNELVPGTALPLAELAATLGVSTMPVRSAISSLEADGLVRQLRHRGAVVAPLELEDLEVIQATRAGIECFAARMGASSLNADEISEIGRLYERCCAIAPKGKLDAYLDAQWQMQDVCYLAAGRPRLLPLINQYRRRAERYIRLAVGGQELRLHLPLHERFVHACRDRDGAAAEVALRQALDWTVETITPLIVALEQKGSEEPSERPPA